MTDTSADARPESAPSASPAVRRTAADLLGSTFTIGEQLGRALKLAPGDRLLALREMIGTYAITTRSRRNLAVLVAQTEATLLELARPHERVAVLREVIRLQESGVSGDELRLAVGAFAMGRPVTRAEVGLADVDSPS